MPQLPTASFGIGFFLHAILPRALELMPTIKCHLGKSFLSFDF